MWRIRSLAVLGVLVGMLLFGATVAYAGWYWNARVNVEGTTVRTIWSVAGDNDGSNNYAAAIGILLPEGAQATLISKVDQETVTIGTDPSLECDSEEIEGVVTYNVTPLTKEVGRMVRVTVKADGVSIGQGVGRLGEDIRVDVSIPVESASCQ
ncbi:MAG: hypothetical protein HW388_650 [Dehalococcoidia bacterium]|nr:hypothetical protein [Dehalococcoidia bacterium]